LALLDKVADVTRVGQINARDVLDDELDGAPTKKTSKREHFDSERGLITAPSEGELDQRSQRTQQILLRSKSKGSKDLL